MFFLCVKGRINNYRDVSSKLIFYDLVQDGAKLQAVFNYSRVGGSIDDFRNTAMLTRVGDIVSVTGHPGRTPAGELSLFAKAHMGVLSPCLHTPPTRILSQEKRHQNRHIDLMVSPTATQILRLRSHIIQHLREQFLDRNFVEVQTPIMAEEAGGAIARPFLTEATAYRGKKLALRIAPELWLKRLVIGGMDRVFEIGIQFRNEGIDATHNPEFTTCEFYQAYAGLEDLIGFTETLFSSLAQKVRVLKEEKFKNLDQLEIGFDSPFKRLEFIPALEQAMGRPLPDLDTQPEEGVRAQLRNLLRELGIAEPESPTVPRILDKLSGAYLEPLCQEPTFITHHPEALSPLAKTSIRDNRRVTERFELCIGGKEFVNAYEEENSPIEQRRKFQMQLQWKDEENSAPEVEGGVDEVYCSALEWGLPPTGGWGLGVDRLCMLFAGVDKISEVLTFGGLRGTVNQGGVQHQQKETKEE
ncbi:hypothetical protein DFP73DRAFT_478458 [Morchella snyderi]|nr:hypothetical protein DFP73DRAFT_478458 [Morchella snyderi]